MQRRVSTPWSGLTLLPCRLGLGQSLLMLWVLRVGITSLLVTSRTVARRLGTSRVVWVVVVVRPREC